jgi:hypothetical protein
MSIKFALRAISVALFLTIVLAFCGVKKVYAQSAKSELFKSPTAIKTDVNYKKLHRKLERIRKQHFRQRARVHRKEARIKKRKEKNAIVFYYMAFSFCFFCSRLCSNLF